MSYKETQNITTKQLQISRENRQLNIFTEYRSNSRRETDAEPKVVTRCQMTSRKFGGWKKVTIDLIRARQVTSDVSHCVRVTFIHIKVVLSKCRKFEISLKHILKRSFFQNNDCTELTSDERTPLDHSGTHLTQLTQFGSSPCQGTCHHATKFLPKNS